MGNLTVARFAHLVGADMTPEELESLELLRTNEARVSDPARFHIFSDTGISIVIGDECMKATSAVWQRINARQQFNREVSFYPAKASRESGDGL